MSQALPCKNESDLISSFRYCSLLPHPHIHLHIPLLLSAPSYPHSAIIHIQLLFCALSPLGSLSSRHYFKAALACCSILIRKAASSQKLLYFSSSSARMVACTGRRRSIKEGGGDGDFIPCFHANLNTTTAVSQRIAINSFVIGANPFVVHNAANDWCALTWFFWYHCLRCCSSACSFSSHSCARAACSTRRSY